MFTVLCWAVLAGSLTADDKPAKPEDQFDEWVRKAEASETSRERLTEQLVPTAADRRLSPEVRTRAIKALARLATRNAFNFFVENVSLKFPGPDANLELPPLWETMPCYYYLNRDAAGESRRDWNVAAAVLRGMNKPRSDQDLAMLCDVLVESLGGPPEKDVAPLALALVEFELGLKPALDRKKNLDSMRALLVKRTGRRVSQP